MSFNKQPFDLKIIKKCPVCAHDYNQQSMQILSESELGFLAYVSCKFCGANLLTKFSPAPHGLIGSAILTDLKAQEVLDFAVGDDLSADEVLAVNQEIYKNNLIKQFRNLI